MAFAALMQRKCISSCGVHQPFRSQSNAATPQTLLAPKSIRSHCRSPTIPALATAGYQAPSSAPAATELQLLEQYTSIVPNTSLLASPDDDDLPNKAATSSAGVIRGILQNPANLPEFKTAVERALVYDKCSALKGEAKAACQLDKALVNVGGIFSRQVDGRVSTEVDPRTAFDTDAIVERGRNLVSLFKEIDVPMDKFLLRIPATWEGIQAAKVLEQEGFATHLILVYSFVQAAAAAQAGVSVISPNVGRIGDFYRRNPGAIRNPRGPRQDAGALNLDNLENPGVELVQRIYNYVQKYYSKTTVMASGVRTSQEAFDLAGIDYMTVSPSVLSSLRKTATLQGYNDGLSGGASDIDGLERVLSPESAEKAEFSENEKADITADLFREGLGQAGLELLQQGVQSLVDSVDRLVPDMSNIAIDAE